MDSKILTTSNGRRKWLFLSIMAITIVSVYIMDRRGVKFRPVPCWLHEQRECYVIDTRALNSSQGISLIDNLVLAGKLNFRFVARQAVDEEWLSPMEREILQDGPVQSLDSVAVPDNSTLLLVSPPRNHKVKVGDKVTVRVDLKDARGRPVRKGGHFVRVWMVQQQVNGRTKRSLAVDVTDLRNGSYVASLPVLWRGEVRVKAALVRTREVRRALLVMKSAMKMSNQVVASFDNGTTQQVTLCSFLPEVPGFPEVCNLTADNSGLPWFCGKPDKAGLTCHHWAWSSHTVFPRRYPLPHTDNLLLQRCGQGSKEWNRWAFLSRQILNITCVEGQMPATSNCTPLRPMDTWTDQSPRGFWEGFDWKPLIGCPLPQKVNRERLSKCYKNTHVLFFADSNARQMMQKPFLTELNCTSLPDPRKWYHPDMQHVPLLYHCPASNTSLAWYPNAYPFFSGRFRWSDVRVKHAPGVILDTLPAVGKYVVVLHLYIHFSPVHLSVYVLHVRSTARAVRRLLARNPQVKVFVRGPHAVSGEEFQLSSDAFSEQALRVLRHEFWDLRERVVLLNTWDMTVANENHDIHPHSSVCLALARMMLAHVCPDVR